MDVINTGKESTEGVLFSSSTPINESKSDISEFQKKYYAKYNENPQILFVAANAYDATNVIIDAITYSENDVDKTKEYLYNMQAYDGVSGTLEFDKFGDSTKSFSLQRIRNGTIATAE